MLTKVPNPTDVYVGSRVRMQRLMLGMTQEALANAINVTFQQVQKYEKGTNRIGASRLQAISGILRVPINFFFQQAGDLPLTLAGIGVTGEAVQTASFLSSKEGIALNKAFLKVKNPKIRKSIIALARALSNGDDDKMVDFNEDANAHRIPLN